MYLINENINVPYVNFTKDIESLTADVTGIAYALKQTIDNVNNIAYFIEGYVKNEFENQKNKSQLKWHPKHMMSFLK